MKYHCTISAYNESTKDNQYFKTNSKVQCIIKDWELRMQGYTTTMVIVEY